MLELRSSQSLTGRINKNIAALIVDTVSNAGVGSGAMVAASAIAVEIDSSESKLLSTIYEIMPKGE
jgi:hypothetical protein